MTPYEEGRHAQYIGLGREDNPYYIPSIAHEDWARGWDESWLDEDYYNRETEWQCEQESEWDSV